MHAVLYATCLICCMYATNSMSCYTTHCKYELMGVRACMKECMRVRVRVYVRVLAHGHVCMYVCVNACECAL
jgi:hypothetical protein